MALPTMSLRPTTAACRPVIPMSYRSNIRMMPAGVHGRGAGTFATRLPTLTGMEAVDVLVGADVREGYAENRLRRKWSLDEDSVVCPGARSALHELIRSSRSSVEIETGGVCFSL